MAESAESYVVHYFNVRGRAEPIRMILSHIGANWKDERITEAHVPEKTKESKYKVILNTVRCVKKKIRFNVGHQKLKLL